MMKPKTYKLDRIAGPSAIFSGYMLMIVGLATVYFSLTAIVLILIGGILVFSYNAITIDPIEGFYRPHVRLFGFVRIGERITMPKDASLALQKFTGSYSASSLSNRIVKSGVSDYRIYLDHKNRKTMLAKFPTQKDAEAEMELLVKLFNR